jgi:type II secretory pathway pseudopilin PulG
MTRHPTSSRPAAYTLTELLVVITIIVLLFTLVVPSLRSLLNAGRVEQGLNVIATAVSAVRTYAGLNTSFPSGEYQGVAILITASGEIRYVQHGWNAANTLGKFLVDEKVPKAGYVDIPDRDYVKLPPGTGVVGLARNATGISGLKLLAPPFAIRFNPQGQLIARINDDASNPYSLVYYDGNYSGLYSTSLGRSNTYDPHPYDPSDVSFVATNYDVVQQKYRIAFEAIETVPGIIVFDMAQLRSAGLNLVATSAGKVNDAARDWILANGSAVYFNRYNGSRIKP